MKHWKKILLGLVIIIGLTLVSNTPARLDYVPVNDANPDLTALTDEPLEQLIPGTEKQVVWHTGEQRTEWSVVALHGFSASRQETAPLAKLVADSLGANLFETRFTAHGLKENGLVSVTAEDWLDDVAEALTVGQMIGEKIVVIAVSNGAALALSMLDHETMQSVDTLVMMSPNFAPADPKAMWITAPGGPLLLRLLTGDTHSWEPLNDLQGRFWTTSYPSKTVIEVMRVVHRANEKIETVKAPRVQVFYSPNDSVISASAVLSGYEKIESTQKAIVSVLETGSPSAHILAGDIISPNNTQLMVEQIEAFILRQDP
jgi:esterase/lipase